MKLPARTRSTGYNDSLGQALTFVLGPVLFGAFGWWLDGLIGTKPVFMILFGLVGAVAVGVWAWATYQTRSARHDEGKPWTRRPA